MSLLRKLFLVREIKSREGVLHFQRWRLVQTPLFAIYVHRIYRADEDAHCHDHPWSFVSFILGGGYDIAGPSGHTSHYDAGSVTYNKSTAFHKIFQVLKRPTTTLVLTGPRYREWGYSVDGEWVHNKEYRERKRAGEWP